MSDGSSESVSVSRLREMAAEGCPHCDQGVRVTGRQETAQKQRQQQPCQPWALEAAWERALQKMTVINAAAIHSQDLLKEVQRLTDGNEESDGGRTPVLHVTDVQVISARGSSIE